MRICTRYEVILITKCTLHRAQKNETALKTMSKRNATFTKNLEQSSSNQAETINTVTEFYIVMYI